MANEYGQDRLFKIYRIASNGQVGAFETFYGFVYVSSFNTHEEAEAWIDNEGLRQADYTILEVIRNK